MTANKRFLEQRFLRLQLNDVEVSARWRELFLNLLPYNRMIILYPLQKQQIENISRVNNNQVFQLAKDYKKTAVTLELLERYSTELVFS